MGVGVIQNVALTGQGWIQLGNFGGVKGERSEQFFGHLAIEARSAEIAPPTCRSLAQPPAGSRGRAPGGGLGGEAPRKILNDFRPFWYSKTASDHEKCRQIW